MTQETEVGSTAELVPGVVRGAGRYAVGNVGRADRRGPGSDGAFLTT
jgi:hypothetical protein